MTTAIQEEVKIESDKHDSVESKPEMPRSSSRTAAFTTEAAASHKHLYRIVLTGFMGAGKSTTGRLLAERLGWKFLDLDTLIEERTKLTIAKLIERDGEAAFRRLESQVLATALGKKHVVLALGGGVAEILTNRLLLEQTPATLTIFLDAPFAVLVERCTQQENAAVRPFLADRVKAEARYRQRLPHYTRIARIRIDTTSLNADATVNALLDKIAQEKLAIHRVAGSIR